MENSTDPSDLPLSEWFWYPRTSPANSVVVASSETYFLQNFHELPLASTSVNLEDPHGLLQDTLWGSPSTQGVPPNPTLGILDPSGLPLQIAAIWSAPTPLPPLPQTPTFPPHNWYCIPQRAYHYGQKQWDFTQSESIYFGVNGHPGVNMGDALLGDFAGLDSRDELVLRNASSAISCRFSFPGYQDASPQIATTRYNKDRDPIKRSRLAHLVARKLKSYLDSMAQEPYTVGETTPRKWKIGEGFMRLENMFLVRLDSVSKGSWQPEIWVMDPTT